MIRERFFLTHLTSQNSEVPVKIRLTVRHRFCYTLDAVIAERIISQRKCQRIQLTPLIRGGSEANKHQHSSHPMVI